MILALMLVALLPLEAAAAGLFCDTPSGPKPAQLVVHAGAGQQLFLCAVKARKRRGGLDIEGFRVFAVGRNGRRAKKPLFESTLDSKTYRAVKAGAELKVSELVSNGKTNVPAFETTIACDPGGCRASKPPKCVFEKPKAGSRRALEQVLEFQHGAKRGKVPPRKLIDSLAALAYAGDEDAGKLFRDRGPLALDGDASDAYFEHQAALNRLRQSGCL